MRWIILPLLWIAALLIAIFVFRRMRSGKKVVLIGRFSPRLVRMIVLVLVVLGVGGDEKDSNRANAYPLHPLGDNPNEQAPANLTQAPVTYWLNYQVPGGHWATFKKEVVGASLGGPAAKQHLATAKAGAANYYPKFKTILFDDLQAIEKGQVAPKVAPKELLGALIEMEQYGFFDHWMSAYLWRKSAGADPKYAADLIELHKRLHQHARVTNSLIAAYAQVRPLMQPPRAWASKAGPRPEDRVMIAAYQRSMLDMLESAKKLYATSDEGTWKRDGLIQLSPVKDAPTPNLLRAGKIKGFPDGEKTRVGRLDLLETPKDKAATLEHEWLGTIELPAGRVVSVWELPKYVSKDAENKLRTTIKDALDGNEKAADQLEKVLPLAHAEIRAALTETPKAKGAPRLRMILTLFDDAVMPALPSAKDLLPIGAFDEGGFERGGGGFGRGGGQRGGDR